MKRLRMPLRMMRNFKKNRESKKALDILREEIERIKRDPAKKIDPRKRSIKATDC